MASGQTWVQPQSSLLQRVLGAANAMALLDYRQQRAEQMRRLMEMRRQAEQYQKALGEAMREAGNDPQRFAESLQAKGLPTHIVEPLRQYVDYVRATGIDTAGQPVVPQLAQQVNRALAADLAANLQGKPVVPGESLRQYVEEQIGSHLISRHAEDPARGVHEVLSSPYLSLPARFTFADKLIGLSTGQENVKQERLQTQQAQEQFQRAREERAVQRLREEAQFAVRHPLGEKLFPERIAALESELAQIDSPRLRAILEVGKKEGPGAIVYALSPEEAEKAEEARLQKVHQAALQIAGELERVPPEQRKAVYDQYVSTLPEPIRRSIPPMESLPVVLRSALPSERAKLEAAWIASYADMAQRNQPILRSLAQAVQGAQTVDEFRRAVAAARIPPELAKIIPIPLSDEDLPRVKAELSRMGATPEAALDYWQDLARTNVGGITGRGVRPSYNLQQLEEEEKKLQNTISMLSSALGSGVEVVDGKMFPRRNMFYVSPTGQLQDFSASRGIKPSAREAAAQMMATRLANHIEQMADILYTKSSYLKTVGAQETVSPEDALAEYVLGLGPLLPVIAPKLSERTRSVLQSRGLLGGQQTRGAAQAPPAPQAAAQPMTAQQTQPAQEKRTVSAGGRRFIVGQVVPYRKPDGSVGYGRVAGITADGKLQLNPID